MKTPFSTVLTVLRRHTHAFRQLSLGQAELVRRSLRRLASRSGIAGAPALEERRTDQRCAETIVHDDVRRFVDVTGSKSVMK